MVRKSYYICTCGNKFQTCREYELHLTRLTGCRKYCYDEVVQKLIVKIVCTVEKKIAMFVLDKEIETHKTAHARWALLTSAREEIIKLEAVVNNHKQAFNDEQYKALIDEIIPDLKERLRQEII